MALGLAALAILAIGTWTEFDLALADAAFDPVRREFPLRGSWVAETFGHLWVRRASVVLGAGFIGMAVWDGVRPRPWTAWRRAQVRLVGLAAALIPAGVAALKQLSASHCPWDIDRYGGTAPYVRLLDALPAGVAPGHCMPGGHASSVLWMISLAVFWLPASPRMAAAAFAGLFSLGMAAGVLQQLRGAHFLTHTLWSGWIACAVVLALALVHLLGRRAYPF